jgi:hypothetical protein
MTRPTAMPQSWNVPSVLGRVRSTGGVMTGFPKAAARSIVGAARHAVERTADRPIHDPCLG